MSEASLPRTEPTAALPRTKQRRRTSSLRRIFAIARKESLHVQRDPQALYLALGMPIMLLLLFGYGVSFDMDELPVVLVDEDATPESRALSDAVFASGELRIVGTARSADAAHQIFADREANAVLVLPRGLSESIARGEPVEVQLLVDGVEANSAAQLQGKAEAAVRGCVAVPSAPRPRWR